MAHRVLSASKYLLCACIILAGCSKRTPLIYIDAKVVSIDPATGSIHYHSTPATGIIFALYPNGDTALLQCCRNGREDGYTKRWYPNKQLQEERWFSNGRKEGIHRGWWPDGKAKFAYHFNNDEYNGSLEEWYNNGQPFRTMLYRAGQEEGMQKMWYFNGKLKANYVVIKNRRYGLSGTKNCINPPDSIIAKR